MKGEITKMEEEWVVRYDAFQNDYNYPFPAYNFLPIHPDDLWVIDYIGHYTGSKQEVEFGIVISAIDFVTYAKLITIEKINTWDDIFDKIESEMDCVVPLKVANYLEKHYMKPTPLQTDEKGKPLTYWGGVDFTNPNANNIKSNSTSSLTKISDESWEGCDGCTEQDEVMYKNGYAKGYNAAIAELPKEISDEEIEKAADKYVSEDDYNRYLECFKAGANWMREQLKSR